MKSNQIKKRTVSYLKSSKKEGPPILKSSNARIRGKQRESGVVKCPHMTQCGGCQLLSMSYEQQLQKKQVYLKQLFKAYGPIKPIMGMTHPYYYRNKVHSVFKKERRGGLKAGIYREGTHQVIQTHHCLIEDQRASRIIETIYDLVKSFKYTIFDEDTTQGFFRHVLIRTGKQTGEILVILVTGTLSFPSKKHFIEALLKQHPEITSIVQNINGTRTNMVLGTREITLYGKGYIEDILCGYRFKISAQSFYQVNPEQTEKLYQKAITLAGLTGKETIVDAYCGIGTIGIIASKQCKEVLGVEMNPIAIKDALINAKMNEVKNIKLVAEDASDWMVEQSLQNQKVDVVFMDPPRAGSDHRFMNALIQLAPQKVVYISCNPKTLKRDLDYLTSFDYKVKTIVPVDLFPNTVHVETVVLLQRKNK